jgi:hypothetical protein
MMAVASDGFKMIVTRVLLDAGEYRGYYPPQA